MKRPAIGDKVMDLPTGDIGRVVSRKSETARHVEVRYFGAGRGYVIPTTVDRLRPFTGSLKQVERRTRAMTYTIARMSGKAVRLAARLLAAVQLGGRLTDSPEKFYERAMEETGKSRIELERRHGILTDQFEEKIREEEGFIGDHVDVFDTVKERLKDGFFLQSEVAHDHQLTPGSGQRSPKFDRGFTPKKKAKKSGPSPGDDGTIDKLLKKLRATDDPAEARKLRRNLRKLGHRGGKRG